ncbi:hypothetical protein [Crassaminicella profunda]|uniref:hypothetical protein n=1 Tax=Crassaminicella profunda TaxID=1286698 RepID=UPI001CA6B21D|nr:hypothetical protein [Crassaminicella profunda]QZY56523.1 hypothetical protein K7H06_06255 [Crassaminicella profunda]
MNFENLEMVIEENVLKFLLEDKFQRDIEEAKVYFDNCVGEEVTNDKMMIDFNSWLIYDYRMKDGAAFIEKYYESTKGELSQEERVFIEKRMQSYLSIYEVKELKENKGLLKDIFAKTEILVNLGKFHEKQCKDLIFGRIIKIENEAMFIGNIMYIPALFQNSIERNVIFKYEEYKGKNQYATWKEFLKKNSLLIQKHVDVIADVTNETENEDAYNVWQSIYLIHDVKTIEGILQKHEGIQLDFEEEGSCYFKIFDKDELLAEMVLEKNRIELECNSENERIKVKKLIESILGDLAKHYKDEIIGLEDIV